MLLLDSETQISFSSSNYLTCIGKVKKFIIKSYLNGCNFFIIQILKYHILSIFYKNDRINGQLYLL